MPHPTSPNIRCDRCKAWSPTLGATGLCRLTPSPIVVAANDWCRKFEAIAPPAKPALELMAAVHALVECRGVLGALQSDLRIMDAKTQKRINAAFWAANDCLVDADLDGIPVEDIAAEVARKHTAKPKDTPDAQT